MLIVDLIRILTFPSVQWVSISVDQCNALQAVSLSTSRIRITISFWAALINFNSHSTVLIYSDVKSSQSDGLGSGQWSIFLWFPKCAGDASLATPIASLLRGWIKIILAFVCQTHSFFFLSFFGGRGDDYDFWEYLVSKLVQAYFSDYEHLEMTL